MTAAESSCGTRDSDRADVKVSLSIRTILLVAGAVAIAYALVLISNVLLVVLVSVFGVAVLSPVATAMEQRLGWSRGLCATVLELATLVIIGVAVLVLAHSISGAVRGFSHDLPHIVDKVRHSELGKFINSGSTALDTRRRHASDITRGVREASGGIAHVGVSTAGAIAVFFSVIFLTLFGLIEEPRARDWTGSLRYRGERKRYLQVADRIINTTSRYMLGNLIRPGSVSTLDAFSGGRAEVILGRGSSVESFPLFGYDLADYDQLFEEKTNLFAELLKGGPVTWQGTTRAALYDQDVVPHTEFGPFPTWLGVGGSPESVVRAARYGFSLMLAIIGGPPARFAPFSRLFREALERLGQPPRPVGVHAPGHVAATDEQAVDEFWPRWLETIRRVSTERGFRVPTRESFMADVGPQGALYVGSPETVAQKIVANLGALEANRFDLKFGMPGLSQEVVMTNIELYANEVIPRVRELWAQRGPEPVSVGRELL
jgi:alkanesulfonate monooxygenase SsuD/methylene tetrahydromethanopterin reductase-like flavin-dependent oxidoreductase (luciferase family)